MSPLPLRYPAHGRPIAKDGIILVLFVRKSHHAIAAEVGHFFEAFQSYIGEDKLKHISSPNGIWKPLTARRLSNANKRMSAAATSGLPNSSILIKGPGSEQEIGDYGFFYIGNEIDGEGQENYASSVEIWLPTDLPKQRGLGIFSRDLITLASLLPFSSGYCSLAINYEAYNVAKVERELTPKLAMLHPGFDIHQTSVTQLQIGDLIKGAYWLTLLGPSVLKKLNMNAAKASAALNEAKIRIHTLDEGLAIVAGAELQAGDVDNRLPLTRKVATLLEEVTLFPSWGAYGFRIEGPMTHFQAWLRRHLDKCA